MKAYWLRIAAAWILLKFASRVMKDAESILRQATDSTQLEHETEIVEAEVVTAEVRNIA